MKEKNRFRFMAFALIFVYILGFNISLNAETIAINYEAPIYMNKSIVDNKTQVLLEDTFTVTYKFQPQDIPANNILPESYQKDKEIVLVIDTSGSMGWDVNGNTIQSGYWSDYYIIDKALYIADNTAYMKDPNIEVSATDPWDVRYAIRVNYGEDYDYIRNGKYYKYHYYQYTYYKRDWIVSEVQSRLELAKASAKNFLRQLEGMSNVKVAIVEYNSNVSIKYSNSTALLSVNNTSNYSFLVSAIDNLNAGGGTNIGLGMYKGFKLLESSNQDAEKYFIFLTDGAPTYHSYYDNDGDNVKDSGENYYTYESQYNSPKLGGSGSSDPYDTSLNYGKAVGQLMSGTNMNLTSYFVAFADQDAANKLETISNSANGNYNSAMTGNALEAIYDDLGDQISSDISIKNVYFEETFPTGLEIVSYPSNMTKVDNTVKGSFGSINYNLNDAGTLFVAEAKEFTITLRAKAVGEYVLGANNTSYIRYTDLDNTIKIKPFSELNISVYEDLPPVFTADLSNSVGNLTSYTLIINLEEDSNLEVLNINDAILFSNATAVVGINTFTLSEDQLIGNYLKVRATDQFNNTSLETVPILNVVSFEKEAASDLVIQTQLNSTIKSLYVNDILKDENRLTNELGQYKKEVQLIEGDNHLKAIAANSFGNSSALYFTQDLALDNEKPIITTNYSPKFVVKNDGYLTLTIFVESNGTGSEIIETHFIKLPNGTSEATENDFVSIIGTNSDLLTEMTVEEIDAIAEFAINKDHVEFKHEKFIVTSNGYYAIYAKDRGGNEAVKVIKINNFIENLPELL